MVLWIHQVATWIKSRPIRTSIYAVLAMVSCAILFLPNAFADCKETEIRLLGLIFQILGFVEIALQLESRLNLFQKPSFLSSLGRYWKRVKSGHTKNIDISLNSLRGASVSKLGISVTHESNSPLERRMTALENGVNDLRSELGDIKTALSQHKEVSRRSLKAVKEGFETRHEKLETLVDRAVVGESHLEWVCILLLLVGVVLSTTAPEIAIWSGYRGQCCQ